MVHQCPNVNHFSVPDVYHVHVRVVAAERSLFGGVTVFAANGVFARWNLDLVHKYAWSSRQMLPVKNAIMTP
jgi:hypothetical protein